MTFPREGQRQRDTGRFGSTDFEADFFFGFEAVLATDLVLRVAAEAGFDCVEPWDRELEQYEREGGDLKDIKKLVADLGLYIPSVIGLWNALDISKEKFEARIEEDG